MIVRFFSDDFQRWNPWNTNLFQVCGLDARQKNLISGPRNDAWKQRKGRQTWLPTHPHRHACRSQAIITATDEILCSETVGVASHLPNWISKRNWFKKGICQLFINSSTPRMGGKNFFQIKETKITQSKIHRDHVCMGHRGQTPCPNAFWYPTTIKMASISAWENGEESSSFSEPKPFYSNDFETSKWKHHKNTCVSREIFYGNAGLLRGWSNNLCPSNMSWKFLMSVQIDVGSCAMRLSMALLSGRQKLWSSHVFW